MGINMIANICFPLVIWCGLCGDSLQGKLSQENENICVEISPCESCKSASDYFTNHYNENKRSKKK